MQFLGLVQYYHQYIRNFAGIAAPLTALTSKNVTFNWTPECDLSMDQLKQAATSAPVLHLFNPQLPIIVETDASGFAVGAVLLQTSPDNKNHPIAFTSRKLNSAERNYPVHEQELLAVVHALKKWRYYLDGTHFTVHTDHATLKHFPTQLNLTK